MSVYTVVVLCQADAYLAVVWALEAFRQPEKNIEPREQTIVHSAYHVGSAYGTLLTEPLFSARMTGSSPSILPIRRRW